MKKIIFSLFLFTFLIANENNIEKLKKCSDEGDQKCSIKLSKELIKKIETREEGMERLLELTLLGNDKAPTILGKTMIYGKGSKNECKKGITFLLLATKKDPEAIKELSLLFKKGQCLKKDLKKYNKYNKIYLNEKMKIESKNDNTFIKDNSKNQKQIKKMTPLN